MGNHKIAFSFLILITLLNCGRNEPEEKSEKKTSISEAPKVIQDTITAEKPGIDLDSGLNTVLQNKNTSVKTTKTVNAPIKTGILESQIIETPNPSVKNEVEKVINSPLKNFLYNAQLGKSYTKKELIEQYKFPKEAVDLIKHVTCVGPNKLYFKWGSTWLVEKVSDAKFKNDTMIFNFKQNKTYVSGGAIGIKYNKKIYTDLILNNGSAYIPSVKGYHWEINK